MSRCGEPDNSLHKEIDSDAVEHPRNNWMLHEEAEPTTNDYKHSSC